MELNKIVDTIQEKLGKEESGKIADDLANILVFEEANAKMTACLRCGRCNDACSLGLVPQMMAAAAERKDYDRFENKLYGMECVACGSCTYICPAKRPLMQLFKKRESRR